MSSGDQTSLLCQAVLDGTATPAETARLSALLAEEDEARRLYVRLAGQEASLQWYAAEMQSEASPGLQVIPGPTGTRRGVARWWPALGGLAAAAAVALAFFRHPLQEPPGSMRAKAAAVVEAEESVACIAHSKEGAWKGPARSPGETLASGERVEINAGFVEIAFDSGASVTLEGPASLEIVSAWEARLEHGSLRAQVPAESAGFRVLTAAVEVVDLGTEFSLVADGAGSAEVFVLQGSVEATPRGPRAGERLLLREKEARRFAAAGVAEVPDRDSKLARLARRVAWDRSLAPARFERWSFGGTELGEPRQVAGLPLLHLVSSAPAAAPGVERPALAGPFGPALELAGAEQWSGRSSAWPRSTQGTLAFWVRVPVEAASSPGGRSTPLLDWRIPGVIPGSLSLGWNRDPRLGALGAVQSALGRGYVTGTTALRDGRWHHLAVAYTLGSKGNKFQMKQYVDARLEAASARKANRRPRAAAEATADGPATLSIGPATGVAFAELVLADRLLTAREIRGLMKGNTLGETAEVF